MVNAKLPGIEVLAPDKVTVGVPADTTILPCSELLPAVQEMDGLLVVRMAPAPRVKVLPTREAEPGPEMASVPDPAATDTDGTAKATEAAMAIVAVPEVGPVIAIPLRSVALPAISVTPLFNTKLALALPVKVAVEVMVVAVGFKVTARPVTIRAPEKLIG